MRFLADTKLADGALFDVDGFRNELTVEWPGIMMSADHSEIVIAIVDT